MIKGKNDEIDSLLKEMADLNREARKEQRKDLRSRYEEFSPPWGFMFCSFLKLNSCEVAFWKNLDNCPRAYDCSSLTPGHYVLKSFNWKHSPEGGDYWEQKSNAWLEIVGKEKKKLEESGYAPTPEGIAAFDKQKEFPYKAMGFPWGDMFRSFLQTEGCEKEFWKNVERSPKERDYKKADPASYVAGGFTWTGSPEGVDFWEALSNRWRKTVETHQEQIDEAEREEDFHMIPEEWRQHFKDFLFIKGLRYAWLSKFKKTKHEVAPPSSDPDNVFEISFIWGSTPEGKDFWRGVAEDWKDYYERKCKGRE